HRALALVQSRPVKTASVVKRPAVDVDPTAGRIDADDVRAQSREGATAERRGDECRVLNDAQPGENPGVSWAWRHPGPRLSAAATAARESHRRVRRWPRAQALASAPPRAARSRSPSE